MKTRKKYKRFAKTTHIIDDDVERRFDNGMYALKQLVRAGNDGNLGIVIPKPTHNVSISAMKMFGPKPAIDAAEGAL